MSSILDFMKSPEPIDEIQDQEVVKKQYRYWRIRIFYAMYIGYVFYYFTRKSFTFAMPYLISDLGFTKSDLGILGSVLYITYGISKFVSGILSDKSNPRFFMAIGLIITGGINLLFGMSSSLWVFTILWGLNGWFQAFGWPPCSRLLSHWYSKSERGTWWSIWSTSHNLGGFLIPFLVLAVVVDMGMSWRFGMYVPGIICILAGFFLLNRLRDTPQSLGLPAIEKYRKDHIDTEDSKSTCSLSFKEILFKYVLKNPYIWLLALASIFIYIIRTAMSDWTLLYLNEFKGMSYKHATWAVGGFEFGGFVGMLFAGWLSDKFSSGRRGPMNVLFSLAMLLSIFAFWLYPGSSPFINITLVSSIGFFLFGPQMLIGLAAAELSHKNATGTATGFTGWFAYFGAALAGYPIGYLVDNMGWGSYFMAIAICGICAFLLFLPLWSAGEKKSKISLA